jgi:hypothetical protein
MSLLELSWMPCGLQRLCPGTSGTQLAGLLREGEHNMASTLLGGSGKDRITNKGHGTDSLGPSDTSDSASDISGAPGVVEGDVIGLDRGTNEDLDSGGRFRTAGPDIGDAELDSDSDSVGTGEHLTAGRDQVGANSDIRPDRIEHLPDVASDADLEDEGRG